jgi:hypothetical protein
LALYKRATDSDVFIFFLKKISYQKNSTAPVGAARLPPAPSNVFALDGLKIEDGCILKKIKDAIESDIFV